MTEKKTIFKTFEWQIENVSREEFVNYGDHDWFPSPTFHVLFGSEVAEWDFILYPNKKRHDGKYCIRLYLRSLNFRDLKCKFEDLQALHSVGIRRQCGIEDYMCIVDGLGIISQFAFSDRISHDELFDPVNSFIMDSKLTIFCEVQISKLSENHEDTQVSPMKTCRSRYKEFFNDKLHADFKLKMSDGKTLTAHKSFLAVGSPVFYAMLKPQTKESQENHVDIPDFDSNIMKEILRFIYYFEVENLNVIAAELIHAAEKYELTELKEICLKSLLSTLSTENVLDYLAIADLVSGAEKLYEKCLTVIFRFSNYYKVKQSDSWKKLSEGLKVRVLEQMIEDMKEHSLRVSTCFPLEPPTKKHKKK